MTDILSGLCLVGLFGLLVFFIIYAISRGEKEPETNRVRRQRPRYDDKDIRSSGGFGRPAPPPNPDYDTPEIRSGGSFRKPTRMKDRSRSSGLGGALGRRSPRRNDDDNIESSGSFGGR
ncbi:MAG: hypothetical protein L0154_11790 [Chloroflexi bacterium]|nr:hypothetical protein [Chloroflexota bacterium]